MSLADWLLMLHITAAFSLLGGAVAVSIFNTLSIGAEQPSQAAQLLLLAKRSLPFILAGSVGTLVFGLWLWHQKGYGIGSGWIWASLVLWLAANGFGQAGGGRLQAAGKLAGQLAAAGDTMTDELRKLLHERRGNTFTYLAALSGVAVLVLMIWKPGA